MCDRLFPWRSLYSGLFSHPLGLFCNWLCPPMILTRKSFFLHPLDSLGSTDPTLCWVHPSRGSLFTLLGWFPPDRAFMFRCGGLSVFSCFLQKIGKPGVSGRSMACPCGANIFFCYTSCQPPSGKSLYPRCCVPQIIQ